MKVAGFPFCLSPFFPPSCSVSRRPIWAGTRGDNLLVGPGTPPGSKRRHMHNWVRGFPRGENPRSGTGMGENLLRHTSRGWGRGFFSPAGTGMGAQPSTENSPLSSLDSWLAVCRTLHYIHVRVERNKSVFTHLAPRSMMLRYITSVASVSHKR
jgi:hypothetical protein